MGKRLSSWLDPIHEFLNVLLRAEIGIYDGGILYYVVSMLNRGGKYVFYVLYVFLT